MALRQEISPGFSRHYRLLAVAVLALAVFNVTFRLGRESVAEWDESLYATSAWEMTTSGDLVGTTFNGELDYYNSKPPLNVWLLATSFSLFGVNLVSLRVASAMAAVLAVWVLQWWTRRTCGPGVSILASLVLATSFGYLHQHSARSGNPDALLTLLILLVVVVLWRSRQQPAVRIWLGPILGAIVLLKGFAVVLPLVIVVGFEMWGERPSREQAPVAYLRACALFAVVVGGWVAARHAVDGWLFFDRMVANDLFGVTLTPLEGHENGTLFYLDVLQRNQYEWLIAAALALAAARLGRGARPTSAWTVGSMRDPFAVLLALWGLATFVVPSLMRTRLAWYLNPFYPLFALLVGKAIASSLQASNATWRRVVLATVILAAGASEGRTLWRLFMVTNLDGSVQGTLMTALAGTPDRHVYRDRLVRSEAFVVRAILKGHFEVADPMSDRPPAGAVRGDLLVTSRDLEVPWAHRLSRVDGHTVYELTTGLPSASPAAARVPGNGPPARRGSDTERQRGD